jgi:DUF4097 and DUF4098 domain-containing protein YvlB
MKVSNVLRVTLFALFILVTGCGDLDLNRTIRVADGEKRSADLNSVNGAIIIGKQCEILGNCRTVNGGIEIGDSSSVHDLIAINGSISISENTRITGDVTTINGSIDCASGVVIHDEVSTINGDITLNGTRVENDVKTINGDILFRNKTIVRGDVVIRSRRSGKGFSEDHPVIQIMVQDSSIVEGDIINRDDKRSVKVILSGGGKVEGRILKAEVVQE